MAFLMLIFGAERGKRKGGLASCGPSAREVARSSKTKLKRKGALYAIMAGTGGQRVVLVRRRQHAKFLRVSGEESGVLTS